MPLLIRILLALLAAPAWAETPPIVVGAALSQSGALASLAGDYFKALLLWEEELNAAGGLLGRRVELRVADDESDARLSGERYGELIAGKADLLIGPYGSAATLMASAQAERAQRVLINGAGPALAVHKRSTRYLFQTTMPNSSYGDGVLELARSSGLASVYILARDDVAAGEMADAAHERALKQGLSARLEVYRAGVDGFSAFVAKAAGADAWIEFGEVHDTASLLRASKKLGHAPGLFFARGAADPRLIELVGQDAEFALATREYDPRFKTAGNARFVAAFVARWSSPPSFAAAQAQAAGTVLAEAVRRTGSLDQAKLRATLAGMRIDTVLGGYEVDPKTGEQRAAKPAVVQIQRGRPEVVWPPALRTAQLQPYPQWRERRLID